MSFCEADFDLPTADIQEPHGLEVPPADGADAALVLARPFYPDLPLSEEDFKCSICLYLLHKPCMNSCGHVFCFWCIHLAMNGVGSSQCPLCRAPYTHLPSICVPLHHFVALQFPAEAHQRAIEVSQEEALVGVHSPTLAGPPRYGVFADHFNCLQCGRLAYEPTVTSCGHIFCRGCLTGLVAQGPVFCPAEHCTAILRTAPDRCLLLHELLQAALPQPYAERAAKAGRLVAQADDEDDAPQTPLKQVTVERPFSPIEEIEAAQQDPTYMHFGIICDGCGAYPIVGQRWRCRDCPEKIGFDICGDCYSRSVHQQLRTGKFNQTHRPGHRLLLVEQVDDWLHQLKAMHPELSVNQLLSLVTMAMEGLQADAMAPGGTANAPAAEEAAEGAGGADGFEAA